MNARAAISFLLAGAGILLLAWKRDAVLAEVTAVIAGWKKARNAEKYLPTLNTAETRYNIPHDLLARMAYQESRWRDDIVSGELVSSAGALGLMQLVPKYHPSVDPLNVSAAVDYAARYLVALYNQFHTWPLAVAAYNAGPGNVKKYNGVPPFTETKNYVSQIFGDLAPAAASGGGPVAHA